MTQNDDLPCKLRFLLKPGTGSDYYNTCYLDLTYSQYKIVKKIVTTQEKSNQNKEILFQIEDIYENNNSGPIKIRIRTDEDEADIIIDFLTFMKKEEKENNKIKPTIKLNIINKVKQSNNKPVINNVDSKQNNNTNTIIKTTSEEKNNTKKKKIRGYFY